MRYAVSSRTFSIHYFVDGRLVYAGVPESKHAFHARASREAANRGRTVYRSRRMAVTPQWLTARVNGEFAGASKPRGDIGMIGIEHVDRIDTAGGRPYINAETRRTGVFLLRDIIRRRAKARDQDIRQVHFPISDHSIWDLENRPDDLGVTWYLPDLRLDVWDALCGREPWRTIGDGYDGSQPAEARNPLDVVERIEDARELVATIQGHGESVVRLAEAVDAGLRPRG
jgi:hypothetical protein